MSLFLVAGAMFAQPEVGKMFRIKVSDQDLYLTITEYNRADKGGTRGTVPFIAKAVANNDQVWYFEATDNADEFNMLSKSGYYLYHHQWNVLAYNTGETKAVVKFVDNGDGTFKIMNGGSYYKTQTVDGALYPFCDAGEGAAASFSLEEVDEAEFASAITVTYKFMYDGLEKFSQEVKAVKGGSYPDYDTAQLPYGVTAAAKPEGTVEEEQTVVIELTVNELPFVAAANAESIEAWYYVQMHSNSKKYIQYLADQTYIEWEDAEMDEAAKDSYTWAFVGNVFDGFKVVNKAATIEKALQSTGGGDATMVAYAEGTQFVLAATSETSEGAQGGFCLRYPENNQYLNAQSGKVAHWGSTDAGSTFTVAIVEEEPEVPEVDPNDYTSYIKNADLSTSYAEGETSADWDLTNSKGIKSGYARISGKVFDFSQTITLPAGQYKMTAKAAYRFGGDEQAEYDAIKAGGNTHLAKLYAATASYKYETNVMNRYEGASDTDYAAGNGSVTVNGKFVPNSSDAVKAWFDANQYVNELVFNVQADGEVKIGIAKDVESSDYTNIGAWTLTRLGDAEADPTVEEPVYPADVTAQYLTNAGFDDASSWVTEGNVDKSAKEVAGWTVKTTNPDWFYSATFGYGSTATVNNAAAPATNPEGVAEGGALGISVGWGCIVEYTQNVVLPAGAYTLTYKVYNANPDATQASNFFGFTSSEASFYGKTANFAANAWNEYSTTFVLREETAGAISVGIGAVTGGSGANAKIFIDGVTLSYDPELPDVVPAFFADGDYLIVNAATGCYLGGGNDWGTHATLLKKPQFFTLAHKGDNAYTLDSHQSNGGDSHFLSTGLYCDGAAAAWTFAKKENGTYTISNDVNYLAGDGFGKVIVTTTDATAAAAEWTIISRDEAFAALDNATQEAPVDATIYIANPECKRNANGWTLKSADGTADPNNLAMGGGSANANCAESYHSNNGFDMSQTLEGLKPGVYRLNAHAFYRNDGDNTGTFPYVYVNDQQSLFVALTGPENNMASAYASFLNGSYAVESIYFVVAEGDKIKIGVHGENTAFWNIWGEFGLTYYGADASIAEIKASASYAEYYKIAGKPMSAEILATMEAAKAAYETNTSDENLSAFNTAVIAAVASVEAYANNKTAIDAMFALMESTNVYTVEAYEAYKATAEDFLAQYEAGTLTATVDNPATIHGWRAEVDYDDMLLSAFGIKDFETNLYINTWSTEGENDGSEFKVPFFEYWIGDGESLGATTKTATVTGLTPGMCYTAEAWVRVRAKNGVAAADATGITLSVGEGEATDVTEGEVIGTSQFSHAVFTATGVADAEGNLTINFNVLDGNNVSWLSFKNLKYAEDLEAYEALYNLDETIEGEWVDVTNEGAWPIIDHAELLGLGDYWVATNNTRYDEERGVMEFVAGENATASLIQEYCPFGQATYRLTGKAFHNGAVNAVMFVGDQTVEIPAAAEGANFENAEEYFTTFSIEFTCESAWGTQLNVGYSCEFDNAEDFLVVGGLKLEEKKSTTIKSIFMETIMALESLGYQIGGMEALHADQQAMMAKAMPIYEAIQGGQKVLKSEVEKSIEEMQAIMAEINPVAEYYKGEFMDALFAAEEFKWTLDEASEAYADLEAAINEANDVAAVTTVAELEAKVAALEELMKLIETGIESVEADAETVIYDLSGRRVTEMTKGVYIVNGKKVIKK